ncbi:MAG TPA: hypothetical protein DCG57_21965, partial [Candidatus Riflebacteria bacterium]|nr:hypothetical protein [Candidatus Riflebacteria bacterium]
MTDDSSIAAEQIEYADNTLSVVIGSETTRINRNEIKNISFTAQTRTTEVFATDSADLAEILPKAQELLQKYPDAQSILVTEEGNYQHRKDGTNLSRYRCVTYLVQDESLWEAQISLSFDPNRETIRVLHARSYTPDGAVHVLSPDQIKISKGTSGSVYFDQYQDLSFTIPEAAVGGLIDYCYETEEFNPFDRNLF